MKKTIAIAAAAVALVAFTSMASAEVPDYIPMGGVLTDLVGTPLDGFYDVTFAIYDAEIGGSPLWSETHNGANQLQATNGLFTAYLGEVNTLDFADLLDAVELWLGITVGADSEMNRIRMGAVPFAMEAQYCRQVVDVECAEGEFLRGWDDATGDPICELDQSAVLADGGVFDGVTAVYAGTGLLSDGVSSTPTLSADFGEVATAGHTHADMATQTWVNSQSYATEAWVSSQGYATQVWVGANYAPLSHTHADMATQTWVNSQSFATETWVNGQLATYQPDIEGVSCQFGIGSIDDTGLVTCAADPGGGLSPDDLSTVSNDIMTNVLNQTSNSTDTPMAIPTGPTGVSSSILFPSSGTIRVAKVTVNITHPDISELEVRLFSPSATMVTLHNHTDSGTADMSFTYPDDRLPAIGSMDDFIDEQSQGTWTLQVIDNTAGNDGTIDSWSVNLEYLADAEIALSGDLAVAGTLSQSGIPIIGIRLSRKDFTGASAVSFETSDGLNNDLYDHYAIRYDISLSGVYLDASDLVLTLNDIATGYAYVNRGSTGTTGGSDFHVDFIRWTSTRRTRGEIEIYPNNGSSDQFFIEAHIIPASYQYGSSALVFGYLDNTISDLSKIEFASSDSLETLTGTAELYGITNRLSQEP